MYAHFRKDIVENYYHLDIGYLLGMGVIVAGEDIQKYLNFDDDLKFHLRADLTPVDTGIMIVTPINGTPQFIDIRTTVPHFGGHRYWLECPITRKRTTKLYLDIYSNKFVSREALGLGYRSQQFSKKYNHVAYALRMRAKLGENRTI